MPRSMGRDSTDASTMQSHLTQAFFTLTVRITFRALGTSSCCPDFAKVCRSQGSRFRRAPACLFRGEDVQGEADGDGTGEAGAEPEDRYPDRCNDRFAAPETSAGLQLLRPAGVVFLNGYRTASAAVFLSVPTDALFRTLRSLLPLQRGPASNAGTTQPLELSFWRSASSSMAIRTR